MHNHGILKKRAMSLGFFFKLLKILRQFLGTFPAWFSDVYKMRVSTPFANAILVAVNPPFEVEMAITHLLRFLSVGEYQEYLFFQIIDDDFNHWLLWG